MVSPDPDPDPDPNPNSNPSPNPSPNPNQAEKIKREAEEFTRKVDDFAAAFKKKAPLKWEVGSDKAYEQIDRMQLEICEIEEQAAELQEREG